MRAYRFDPLVPTLEKPLEYWVRQNGKSLRLSQLVGLTKIMIYTLNYRTPEIIHLDLFKKRIITNIFGERQVFTFFSSHVAPLNAWGVFAYKLLYKAKVLVKQAYGHHSSHDKPSILLPPTLAHNKIKMLLALAEQVYAIMGVQKTTEIFGFLIDFPEGWYLDNILDTILKIYPVTNVDIYFTKGKRLQQEIPLGYVEVFPDVVEQDSPSILELDVELLCNEAKHIIEELLGDEVLDVKILPGEVYAYTTRAHNITHLVFEEALRAHEMVITLSTLW